MATDWRGHLAEAEASLEARAKDLDEREAVVKKQVAKNAASAASLVERSKDLDGREQQIIVQEQATVQALNKAQDKQQKANILLEGTQERLDFISFKEDELVKRAQILDKKDAELKKRKVWLLDREALQRSH